MFIHVCTHAHNYNIMYTHDALYFRAALVHMQCWVRCECCPCAWGHRLHWIGAGYYVYFCHLWTPPPPHRWLLGGAEGEIGRGSQTTCAWLSVWGRESLLPVELQHWEIWDCTPHQQWLLYCHCNYRHWLTLRMRIQEIILFCFSHHYIPWTQWGVVPFQRPLERHSLVLSPSSL